MESKLKITAEDIKEYLDERGIEIKPDDPDHYIELMADNHKAIEYGNVQYYIPEENNFGIDSEIFDYLIEYFSL